MFGFFYKKREKPRVNQPIEVVDITSPTEQSILGNYFIGQTEELILGGGHRSAWGGLVNPTNSGVILFFDIFTVTNFSTQSFLAEIWLSPNLPGNPSISPYVHPSNLTINPSPIPKVSVQYASSVSENPISGSNPFNRIVQPNSTLISDSSKGSIILPPGGSFIIFLKSTGALTIRSRIVLTWWEETVEL